MVALGGQDLRVSISRLNVFVHPRVVNARSFHWITPALVAEFVECEILANAQYPGWPEQVPAMTNYDFELELIRLNGPNGFEF